MICTRFAPSPTGYLHIGGARTALYSWLYAKNHKGKFILRIEDTDTERSTQEAVDAILEGMTWLGLNHDAGPYFQTQRLDRYQAVIDTLLKEDKAYRCYCSKERLENLREQQISAKEKARYDGQCRNLTATEQDQPFVVRFRNPDSGAVTFDDQVRGHITIQNSELDDLIIARTDGMPTYNFTVVVDDMDMDITHVIRGDDHINNTPRQINIFKALGASPPLYAHVPMILGSDGKRLSKRHGAVSVLQYRTEGFLPEALLNYLVRLGWSHGDQEIFSLDDMITHFSLDHISRSPAIFNLEKLLWLNQHYLKTNTPESVANELAWHLNAMGVVTESGPDLVAIVLALRERAKTLVEMAQKSRFLFEEVTTYDEEAVTKEFNDQTPAILQALQTALSQIDTWDQESIHATVATVTEQLGLKMGKVAQPLRIAVTGSTTSPSIDITLALLGRTKTLERIQRAIDFILTRCL